MEVNTPFMLWPPSSRLSPPWITLAAQDDPAILVGSGESCKEAFNVHKRGSRPRHCGLLLHRSCGSCTEQKEEGLGLWTRMKGLQWFSEADESTSKEGTFLLRACSPVPHPCDSPLATPGCRLCRKCWNPASLGCSLRGMRTAPYLSVKPKSWAGTRATKTNESSSTERDWARGEASIPCRVHHPQPGILAAPPHPSEAAPQRGEWRQG